MDIWGCSCGVPDGWMPEEVANDVRLSLPPAKVTAQGGLQGRLVRRAFLPSHVDLGVVVEVLVRVQLGAVAGKPEKPDPVRMMSSDTIFYEVK